jgi:hypothetical protein
MVVLMSLICIYGKEETHKVHVLTIEVLAILTGKRKLVSLLETRELMWVHVSPSLISSF